MHWSRHKTDISGSCYTNSIVLMHIYFYKYNVIHNIVLYHVYCILYNIIKYLRT